MLSIDYLRHFRVGDYAVFDLSLAFVGMGLLAPLLSMLFLKFGIYIPKINWLFLALPIGILTHILIGRMTPMTKYFLDVNGHYILKIVILVLLVLGLRGIRTV